MLPLKLCLIIVKCKPQDLYNIFDKIVNVLLHNDLDVNQYLQRFYY